jgi:hypothetical protein
MWGSQGGERERERERKGGAGIKPPRIKTWGGRQRRRKQQQPWQSGGESIGGNEAK